jgi:phenylacetate-CoA ligase
VNEDHLLVLVVHPETLRPVKPGEVGELVITTLTKEASPVIRYRTRDLTSLVTAPCACGRTFHRMTRVLGRTDDLLVVNGVKVFPSEIEAILFDVEGTEPHYQIVLERSARADEMTVLVEVSAAVFSDEMKVLAEFAERIRSRLAEELALAVKVKLVPLKALERFEGKARRVVDRRMEGR